MRRLILAVALAAVLPVCAEAAATRKDQRLEVQRMKDRVLTRLYAAEPVARGTMAAAAGYAVFSTADLAAAAFAETGGHGLAHNNANDEETYMGMSAPADIDLGPGVRDVRAVFVFDSVKAYQEFIATGLDLGQDRVPPPRQDAAAGAAAAPNVAPGVRVFQLGATGVMAGARLKGTKYWRDAPLNARDQFAE